MKETCRFAICGLEHLRNLRTCDCVISPIICGFAICGLTKKIACASLSIIHFMYRSVPTHLTVSCWFLINSGWGGGEGGGISAVMLLNRTSEKMVLNRTGGVLGALITANHPWDLVHKTTYALMIYTVLYVTLLMREASITWVSGRGSGQDVWALEISTFWAPNGTSLSAQCHFKGSKKVLISRAQPPPTCPHNGCCPHQKHHDPEPYKS